jgi:hypothetical protein
MQEDRQVRNMQEMMNAVQINPNAAKGNYDTLQAKHNEETKEKREQLAQLEQEARQLREQINQSDEQFHNTSEVKDSEKQIQYSQNQIDLLQRINNAAKKKYSGNRFDELDKLISNLSCDDLEFIKLVIIGDEKIRESFEEYLQYKKYPYIAFTVFFPVSIVFAFSFFIITAMLPMFLENLHELIITGSVLGSLMVLSGIIGLCVALTTNPFRKDGNISEVDENLNYLNNAVILAKQKQNGQFVDQHNSSILTGEFCSDDSTKIEPSSDASNSEPSLNSFGSGSIDT